ncbi:hypothetical protein AGMMS49949_07610 [Alphaproteobacteria bacterium]|nr:hypothetical protein AGMMS49949_07610 [Alphaproteobacteria bacterium]
MCCRVVNKNMTHPHFFGKRRGTSLLAYSNDSHLLEQYELTKFVSSLILFSASIFLESYYSCASAASLGIDTE